MRKYDDGVKTMIAEDLAGELALKGVFGGYKASNKHGDGYSFVTVKGEHTRTFRPTERVPLKDMPAGFYEREISIELDGKRERVTAEIVKTEDGMWVYLINTPAGRQIGAEDRYYTKRDAILALEEAISRGFRYDQGLGWVLNSLRRKRTGAGVIGFTMVEQLQWCESWKIDIENRNGSDIEDDAEWERQKKEALRRLEEIMIATAEASQTLDYEPVRTLLQDSMGMLDDLQLNKDWDRSVKERLRQLNNLDGMSGKSLRKSRTRIGPVEVDTEITMGPPGGLDAEPPKDVLNWDGQVYSVHWTENGQRSYVNPLTGEVMVYTNRRDMSVGLEDLIQDLERKYGNTANEGEKSLRRKSTDDEESSFFDWLQTTEVKVDVQQLLDEISALMNDEVRSGAEGYERALETSLGYSKQLTKALDDQLTQFKEAKKLGFKSLRKKLGDKFFGDTVIEEETVDGVTIRLYRTTLKESEWLQEMVDMEQATQEELSGTVYIVTWDATSDGEMAGYADDSEPWIYTEQSVAMGQFNRLMQDVKRGNVP